MEPELLHLHAFCGSGALALDVGANEGQFSMRLSQRYARVVAFEINAALTTELAAHAGSRVRIVGQGLSSRAGAATLYIPVLDDFPLTGWASLAPGNCPDTSIHQELPVTIATLDSFALADIGFMKIDVEGHELEVLRGALQTLSRSRPTLLVEIKEPNLDAVRELLAKLDYREHRLADLAGIPGSPENYIFKPRMPDLRTG